MKIGLRNLFYEKGSDQLSLGRITFWILLIISIHFWFERPYNEFPTSLSEAFLYVLAYNLFKKGMSIARDYSGQYFSNRYNQNNPNIDPSDYEIRQ